MSDRIKNLRTFLLREPTPALIVLCSLLIGGLSLSVMWAWFTRNSVLIQIDPAFSPMKFNTAVCLFFSSVALFALVQKQRKMVAVGGGVSAALSLLTLLQYIPGVDFGIDTLFMMPFQVTEVAHPGRMAPNTAGAILLTNLALLACAFVRQPKFMRFGEPLMALMGSIVAAIGLVPLIGYMAGIETAYTWGDFSGMAVHTALCCTLLGTCIVIYVWKRSPGTPLWLPIPIGLGLIIIAYSTSHAVSMYDDLQFEKSLQVEADYLTTRGEDRLTAFYAAIDRVANRWVVSGGTPRALWESDAQAYAKAYPFMTALEWVGPDERLQWVIPKEGNEKLPGMLLNTEGTRAETAKLAISTRAPQVTKAVDLLQGGKGFLYMSPLFVKDHFDGMIVAVYTLEKVFSRILERDKDGPFYLEVRDNNALVFSNVPQGAKSERRWLKTSQMKNKDDTWDIAVSPAPAMLAARNATLPTLILAFGLITSFFFVLSIFLANKWKNNALILQESEERFRILMDGASDCAIYMLDPGGQVKSWNAGAERIKGYKSEEIIGQHFSLFYSPEDIARNEPTRILNIAAKLGKFESEGWHIKKDGTRFWASIIINAVRSAGDGDLIGFAEVTRDRTERRAVEQALAESDSLNNAIMASAMYMIIATDTKGKVVFFNRQAEKALGYSAEEVVQKQTPALWHDGDEVVKRARELSVDYGEKVQPGMEVFMKKARTEGIENREWTFIRKDGSRFPGSLSVTSLRGSENEITGWLGVVEDISERKRIEQMKDEFTSTVSHELRTPLTSIRGALGLIVGGAVGTLPAQAAELVKIAHQSCERLIRIVNDILDVEKMESGKMVMAIEPVPVEPFIRKAVEANQAYGDKYGVRFVVKGEQVAGNVLADPDRLMQVFSNLLSNAAKFSHKGGEVHVHTQCQSGMVRFCVEDFGAGIPHEFRSRVFEKFAQADNSDSRRYEGTGLGLNLVKKFVEAMDGDIDFTSQIDVGTVFFFDLPAASLANQSPVNGARHDHTIA